MTTVSFSATPTTLIETEGTVLTFQFTLDEAPPAEGVTVTVNGDRTSSLNALNLFAIEVAGGEFPVGDLLFSGFDFNITSQNATITVPIFNDDDTDPDFNGLREVTYTLAESTDYTVDATASNVTIAFADTADQVADTSGAIEGTKGGDELRGDNTDNEINGLGGKDVLLGLGGSDIISGGGGKDTIEGGGGKDMLFGDGGKDTISGGGGADTLYGGGGSDIISGNGGKDIYVLEKKSGKDTFQGFKDKKDKLGLSNGLTFDELTLSAQGKNTLIKAGNSSLAVLQGVRPDAITEADFVDV